MRLLDRISSKVLQLLAGSVLISCLTPVSVDIGESIPLIVISGQVSTLPDRTYVQVSSTRDPARLPQGTINCEVFLIDENGATNLFTEIVDQQRPGTYKANGFTATPGSSYHIRVRTPDGVFESMPERVPLQTGTDEISYEFTDETVIDAEGIPFKNKMILVYTTPTLPVSDVPVYIRWQLDEVYVIIPTDFPDPFGYVPPNCYVSQTVDPQRIPMYNGINFSEQRTSQILLGKRIAFQTFHYRHYFISYQSAITPEAHEYWTKVDILANQVGSIFDTPPSPITGNVYNVEKPAETVLGYFAAVNESMKRISLTQNELPFKLPDYCNFSAARPFSFWPSECLECISVRNASFERPSWFGE
jgi:hypothetical protein